MARCPSRGIPLGWGLSQLGFSAGAAPGLPDAGSRRSRAGTGTARCGGRQAPPAGPTPLGRRSGIRGMAGPDGVVARTDDRNGGRDGEQGRHQGRVKEAAGTSRPKRRPKNECKSTRGQGKVKGRVEQGRRQGGRTHQLAPPTCFRRRRVKPVRALGVTLIRESHRDSAGGYTDLPADLSASRAVPRPGWLEG